MKLPELSLLDLVLPKACLLCEATGAHCCQRCCDLIARPIAQLYCTGCGLSKQCECTSPHWHVDRSLVFGNYQSPIDKLITGIKFHNRISDAAVLGQLLGRAIAVQFTPRSDKLVSPERFQIVPVPLSHARLRERGFNQAERIATSVYRHLRRHWPEQTISINRSLLVRHSSGSAQSLLTRPERLSNLDHTYAMAATSKMPLPAMVMLIDDVMTTGATINSCALALKQAGVKTVWAAVVARTQGGRNHYHQ